MRKPWSVGKAMTISGGLEWLCAEPRQNFTLSALLRRGWPGFASVVRLPKQLELGRAARLVERVIFFGAMSANRKLCRSYRENATVRDQSL